MTRKDKKEMMDLLLDFHESVVAPGIERIVKESEERLEEQIGEVKNETTSIDLKLTKMVDHQSDKLDDHEVRLARAEKSIGLAG